MDIHIRVFAWIWWLVCVVILSVPQMRLLQYLEISLQLSEIVLLVVVTALMAGSIVLSGLWLAILTGRGRRYALFVLGWMLFLLIVWLFVDTTLQREVGAHLNITMLLFGFVNANDVITLVYNLVSLDVVALLVSGLIMSGVVGWLGSHTYGNLKVLRHVFAPLLLVVGSMMTMSVLCCDMSSSLRRLPSFYVLSILQSKIGIPSSNAQANMPNIPDETRVKLARYIQSHTGHIKLSPMDFPNIELTLKENANLYNVVVIVLESARTDALTPYNPAVSSTPFINEIAKQGMIAETAYVNYAYTTKSLVAVLCGQPPRITHELTETEPGGLPFNCLPKLLEPFGYTSAFFQTATEEYEDRDVLVNNMGFESFISLEDIDATKWERINSFGVEDRALLPKIESWLDTQTTPFFMTVLTLLGHHPYTPPSHFETQDFDGSPTRQNFLNSMLYIDNLLRDIFAAFESRGLLDSTLFVITGDHGVPLDEGDYRAAVDQNLKVPIVLSNPQLISEAQRVNGVRQHTDIVPTIVDLLGFRTPEGALYGTSLKQSVTKRPAYFSCKFDYCLGRATEDYIFVYYPDTDATSLYATDQFNFGATDLIETVPGTIKHDYLQELKTWQYFVNQAYVLNERYR